jgi:hypothetical protein
MEGHWRKKKKIPDAIIRLCFFDTGQSIFRAVQDRCLQSDYVSPNRGEMK